MGKRGRRSVPRLFSGPPRPSKVATALCRRGITIIVAYRSAVTRSGPCCSTSTGAPQRGQRRLHGVADEHFPTSLRPCSLRLATCPGRANDIRPWRSVIDAIECPALSECSSSAAEGSRCNFLRRGRSTNTCRHAAQAFSCQNKAPVLIGAISSLSMPQTRHQVPKRS